VIRNPLHEVFVIEKIQRALPPASIILEVLGNGDVRFVDVQLMTLRGNQRRRVRVSDGTEEVYVGGGEGTGS